MFDSVKKSVQHDSKQNVGTWAQPVTEVHTSIDVNADSKTYHPTKPSKPKKSILPILLGLLFLIILAGGGYWWWMNNIAGFEEVVVADNAIVETEEKAMEEEVVADNVSLIFLTNYLMGRELPEAFEYDATIDSGGVRGDDLNILSSMYNSPNITSIEEATISLELPEYEGIYIIMIKYKSNDLLDIEVDKITNTKTSGFLRADTEVLFIRKGDVLIILSSELNNNRLEALVDIFTDELDAEILKTIEWDISDVDAAKNPPSTSEWLHCYVMINPEEISYFPEVEFKARLVADIAIISDKEDFIEKNCFYIDEKSAELKSIVQMLHTDKDKDGLNLLFEMVYGSSDEKLDTDGDGYDDLTEVESGYHPVINETGEGKYISDDGTEYITYTDSDFGYSVLRPKNWATKITNYSDDLGEAVVVMMPGLELRSNYFIETSEHIKISASIIGSSVEEIGNSAEEVREALLPSHGWEKGMFAGLPADIKSDGTAVLIFKESPTNDDIYMYVLKYDYKWMEEIDLEYMTIFQEMLASFKFLEE